MTAIVGILNKRAVAIAADSAVTVINGNNTKIYNTSQKIFKLSDKNPVAVMIYDSSSFMETPLEVIIDLYRQERGENTFKRVQDYASDFMRFLCDCDYFNGEQEQKNYFIREMFSVYDKLNGAIEARATEEAEALVEATEDQVRDIWQKHDIAVHQELEDLCKEVGKVDDLKDMTLKEFSRKTGSNLDYFVTEVLEEQWEDEKKEKWLNTFYNYFTSRFFYNQTGLVFIGYGSKDIYPSLYSVYVSGIFNDSLRWLEDEKEDIQNSNTASIIPFAQTDVMMTMLKGISPAFQNELMNSHKCSVEKVLVKVQEILSESGVDENIVNKVMDIDVDDVQKGYEDNCINFMKDNYTTGVVDAVEFFNVEDMANMAESLISITNLQRHFSSSEESVGGPVEVAVITRGGGFRWIKHKQW